MSKKCKSSSIMLGLLWLVAILAGDWLFKRKWLAAESALKTMGVTDK